MRSMRNPVVVQFENENFTLVLNLSGLSKLRYAKTLKHGLKPDGFQNRPAIHFARIHQTLRVTPAMEAGIANHVWSLEEIVGLLP